jgi:predicted DNA-binding transcriptional regulator YafY
MLAVKGPDLSYETAEQLLRLIVTLQASGGGLTMAELREKLDGAGRRKVERMLRAVERLYPQLEEAPTGERVKRWRLPPNAAAGLADIAADDLAALSTASALLRRENLDGEASRIDNLSARLRARLTPAGKRRIEPDLEAMTEAEGIALRPGPRPKIDPEVLSSLRHAIKANLKVRLHYRSRTTGATSRQLVCPYGFLYGNRHYLVAFNLNRSVRAYRYFSLSNIARAEVTDWPFRRDPKFSLKAQAERSFGVFQEKPFNVVWKFSPQAAPDAREFLLADRALPGRRASGDGMAPGDVGLPCRSLATAPIAPTIGLSTLIQRDS